MHPWDKQVVGGRRGLLKTQNEKYRRIYVFQWNRSLFGSFGAFEAMSRLRLMVTHVCDSSEDLGRVWHCRFHVMGKRVTTLLNLDTPVAMDKR